MIADFLILGSGFAGSLCALILKRLGRSVAVVDRGRHPRFAIGESSTPTANLVLLALCDRYNLPALRPLATYGTWQSAYPHLGCGRKRGFSYVAHQRGQPFAPDPHHGNELLVAASPSDERSDTQWLRADVDAFFAEQVRAEGIPLFEEATIASIAPGSRWRVDAMVDGRPLTIDAGFAIDAAGAGGVLSGALGLADDAPRLHTRSRALFTHVDRLPTWASCYTASGGSLHDHPFACDDAALHHLIEHGWMWWLRFNNGRTSAGFVLDERRHTAGTSAGAEWAALLAAYPSLADAFAGAQLADAPGRIVRTGRLQRLAGRIAGPNWALLPHAAGFVDPLHSTGIAHSMLGVERLMRTVETQWGRPGFADALAGYAHSVRQELLHIDRLVDGSYAALGNFRLFTAFTMLYFAAAIAYEERRIKQGIDTDWLLMAGDPWLASTVRAFHRIVRAAAFRNDREVATFERAVAEAIEPYNTAGLFAPAVPNMYAYTAASF